MKKYINDQSPAVLALIDCILKAPGIDCAALSAQTGYSISHTKAALSRATKTGKVMPVMVTNRTVNWFPKAQAMAMLAARNAKRAAAAEKTAERKGKVTDRDMVLQMAALECGLSVKVAASRSGIKPRSTWRHCIVLESRGLLFRSKRPGCIAHWFDSKERAESWAKLPAPIIGEQSESQFVRWQEHPARLRRMADIGERIKSSARQPGKAPPKLKGSQRNIPGDQLVVKAKPGKAAPVSIKPRPYSPPDFSRARLTKVDPPPFTCRWQQQPDSGGSIFADWPKYGTGA